MNKSPPVKPLSSFASWNACRLLPQGRGGSTNHREIYCPKRIGHVAVCVLDELLVWGGYYHKDILWDLYCDKREIWNFNLDMDRWFRYIPHGHGPHHMSGASSVVVWPYWYIFFGHMKKYDTNKMYRLNLQTCSWESVQQKGPTISPRNKCPAWVYDKKIFIFGGYGDFPKEDNLWNAETDICEAEEYGDTGGWSNQIASFDISTNEWQLVETKGPRPSARAAHSAVRVKQAVYIFGGCQCGHRTADLHRLDLTNYTWSGELSYQGPKPEGRSWHTMTALNKQHLILMGGYSDDGQNLDDLWLLSLEPLAWSLLQQATFRFRVWHTGCANSMGDVLIFGGCTTNIYDTSFIQQSNNHVLTVRLEPYSLERLCLHVLWNNRHSTSISRGSLPQASLTWLKNRWKALSDLNRRVYKCQASAIYGPELSQLSVMQLEEAEYINRRI